MIFLLIFLFQLIIIFYIIFINIKLIYKNLKGNHDPLDFYDSDTFNKTLAPNNKFISIHKRDFVINEKLRILAIGGSTPAFFVNEENNQIIK